MAATLARPEALEQPPAASPQAMAPDAAAAPPAADRGPLARTASASKLTDMQHSSHANTPTTHHSVIPAYPYNVSMSPFVPGSSSNRADFFDQHVPDDSNVQSRLPSIAVDYLSHDWQEDDVWTSWKAMTKHKSEIANGVRLENASWRTWAKQRGKLKTISPETLNWLKDSDVTWLYGPLHTAVDPVPPPKAATTEDRLGLAGAPKSKTADVVSSRSYSSSSTTPAGHHGVPLTVKPILKHRSLSDILSVPSSGAPSPSAEYGHSSSEDEEGSSRSDNPYFPRASGSASSDAGSQSTTSEADTSSHKQRRSSDGPHRKPCISTSGHGPRQSFDSHSTKSPTYDPAPHDLPSDSTYRRSSAQDHSQPKKRHITFNHRVEQCISVDTEDQASSSSSGTNLAGGRGGKQPYSNALQRYNSNTASQQQSSSSSSSASSSDDEDDDDEEPLTFRSSSPKSPTHVKPFLNSPSGANTGLPGSGKIAYGTHGPHGVEPDEPHTIAMLAPTTLKENELMPGPTPIVVFEDGKITAFYGTEDDYVYDAEEHGGLPNWAPQSASALSGTAVADEEEDEPTIEIATADLPLGGSRGHATNAGKDAERKAATPTSASPTASKPVTSSARYADANSGVLGIPEGTTQQGGPSAPVPTGFFAGPDAALDDEYDSRYATASQAKFGAHSGRGGNLAPGSMPISATSSGSSTEVNSLSTSPNNSLLYSASPSGARGPTKSILKKGRDLSQPGSADYYPPLPPAVTRASRAHAQMFDDNGEVILSPGRSTTNLPENASYQGGPSANSNSAADLSSGHSNSYTSLVSSAAGLDINNPSMAYQEPARGRSISRGNSSSSLYERAQAATAEYRSRSQSGGSSLSPAASYSPPFSAGLNALGAGTAVMANEPANLNRTRGRGDLQSTRPSNRREALSDSSSENDSDTESAGTATSDNEDDGAATGLELGDETVRETNYTSAPKNAGVQFARSQGRNTMHNGGRTMRQSHDVTMHDSDEGLLEQVSSPDGSLERSGPSSAHRPGFDSRPAKAAPAGRQLATPSTKQALSASSKSQRDSGNAALYKAGTSKAVQLLEQQNARRRKGLDTAGEGEGIDDDDDDPDGDDDSDAGGLFDSPYMPSSPRIASSSNLTALDNGEGKALGPGKQGPAPDPYVLSWADKDDSLDKTEKQKNGRERSASSSLLASLASSASRPSWLDRRRSGRASEPLPAIKTSHATGSSSRKGATRDAATSEDDLSDFNNGYAYSYGFDDDDVENSGYVGRATELLGALWNVGSGIIWGKGGSQEGSSSSPHPPSREGR